MHATDREAITISQGLGSSKVWVKSLNYWDTRDHHHHHHQYIYIISWIRRNSLLSWEDTYEGITITITMECMDNNGSRYHMQKTVSLYYIICTYLINNVQVSFSCCHAIASPIIFYLIPSYYQLFFIYTLYVKLIYIANQIIIVNFLIISSNKKNIIIVMKILGGNGP